MTDLKLLLNCEEELSRLLALNREDLISPEQLERLDLLLQHRGQTIDEQISPQDDFATL